MFHLSTGRNRVLRATGAVLSALLVAAAVRPATAAEAAMPELRISAFRDISAFVLEGLSADPAFALKVHYVANADEAHADLKERRADLVFMSYDDTISIYVQDGYTDIAAVMPVHGGILDLCGRLDTTTARIRVGIDTDSGYARALRLHLHRQFPAPADYGRIDWIRAGATNLRYDQLVAGTLDATLLNPPFSYRPGVARIAPLSGGSDLPAYQGVVVNLNRSWLTESTNRAILTRFLAAWRERIDTLRTQPDATSRALADFYHLAPADARAVYERLWAPDGLAPTADFDPAALAATEAVFAADTGLPVPKARTWVLMATPEAAGSTGLRP